MPTAGLELGCPTSEDSLHIARLFRGNVSYQKPFGEPKRHLAAIFNVIIPNNQQFTIYEVYEKCTIETICGK